MTPDNFKINPDDIQQLMAKAQEMQSRMRDAQDDLEKFTVIGTAGAGLVEVKLNGKYNAIAVVLDEDVMEENKSVLEGLIAAAINDAVRKIEKETQDKLWQLTQGLKLPPGFNDDKK